MTHKGEYQWFTPPDPLVTKCCGSLRWAETTLGTYCYSCETVELDNVRKMNQSEKDTLEKRINTVLNAIPGLDKEKEKKFFDLFFKGL